MPPLIYTLHKKERLLIFSNLHLLYSREDNVEIVRFVQQHLQNILSQQKHSLALCHFRDPWSGVPILSVKNRPYRTVYEVNGLPSIELPYAFPHIATPTLEKISALEDLCLQECDAIVVPSFTIENNLIARGVAQQQRKQGQTYPSNIFYILVQYSHGRESIHCLGPFHC